MQNLKNNEIKQSMVLLLNEWAAEYDQGSTKRVKGYFEVKVFISIWMKFRAALNFFLIVLILLSDKYSSTVDVIFGDNTDVPDPLLHSYDRS